MVKDTFGMLKEMIDFAEKRGVYDRFDDLELEAQKIIKKAKAFHKKIEEMYKIFKLEKY